MVRNSTELPLFWIIHLCLLLRMTFQLHFRYYLALVLIILLAMGVRTQVAPLGVSVANADQPAPKPAAPNQANSATAVATLR